MIEEVRWLKDSFAGEVPHKTPESRGVVGRGSRLYGVRPLRTCGGVNDAFDLIVQSGDPGVARVSEAHRVALSDEGLSQRRDSAIECFPVASGDVATRGAV